MRNHRAGRLVLLTAVAVLPGNGASTAAVPGWSAQSATQPHVPAGSLASVSCWDGADCLAVGQYRTSTGAIAPLAERWDGARWALVPMPAPAPLVAVHVRAVDCASTGICLAVGTYGTSTADRRLFAERWDGARWTVTSAPPQPAASLVDLAGVSCVRAALCSAAGSFFASGRWHTLIEKWDGTAWAIVPGADLPPAVSAQLNGVSCFSAGSCTVVGIADDYPLAETWNGTVWTIAATAGPGGHASLSAVSCSSATACMATGSAGYGEPLAERRSGATWTIATVPHPDPRAVDTLTSVSCPSIDTCSAVGYGNRLGNPHRTRAWRWDGSTWSAQTIPNRSGDDDLYGVSCADATRCVAVGSVTGQSAPRPLAVDWDGIAWAVRQIPATDGGDDAAFEDVSCPAVGFCAAVGRAGPLAHLRPFAELRTGTTWSIAALPTLPDDGSALLYGVSCTSATFCMAVGAHVGSPQETLAMRWDGTAWTLLSTPSRRADFVNLTGVSCVSATSCVAVGEADGDPLLERWNGTAWTVMTAPALPPHRILSVGRLSCTGPTACLVVGAEQDPGTSEFAPISLVLRTSGWSVVLPQQPGLHGSALNGVACSSATDCTAVGTQQPTTSSLARSLIETWDGATWSVVTSADVAGASTEPTAVSCASTDRCVAVGESVDNATYLATALIEVWNGTQWQLAAAPVPAGSVSSGLAGVSCPTQDDCTAVGSALLPGGSQLFAAVGSA